jgi:hypothetical protein
MTGAASLQALKSTSRMYLYNSRESLSIVMCTGVVRQSLAMARRFSIAAVIGVVPPVAGVGGG